MPRNKFAVAEIRECCECEKIFETKNWIKKTCSKECSRELQLKTNRRCAARYYRKIMVILELKAAYLNRKRKYKQFALDKRKNYMRDYLRARYARKKVQS